MGDGLADRLTHDEQRIDVRQNRRGDLVGVNRDQEEAGPAIYPLAQSLALLRQQVMRLIHLMRELLEFGRPVAVTLVPGVLREVVDDAVGGRRDAASAAGVTLHNAVPADLPAVPMDYGRLRQVFENLIDNAMHAPAVRSITVGAREIVQAGHRMHGGR